MGTIIDCELLTSIFLDHFDLARVVTLVYQIVHFFIVHAEAVADLGNWLFQLLFSL